MAGYPPGAPPAPPPGYDPRAYRRYLRDQSRAQRAALRAQREQMRYQMRSLRRRSILGPILLIAVGVLFLLMNSGHMDRRYFWDWYGHWWPLLLVGAGIVVLAEWAFDQFGPHDLQRPAYRRSLGGGVFTLLLLIGITGVIAETTRFHFPPNRLFSGWNIDPDTLDQFLGEKHESDQTLDLAFPEGGSLTVVNPRGDVTVSGTSDDGRVHLAIHKEVWDRADSGAESKAQQLTPTTDTAGSVVNIAMPSLDGARADLTITVPAAAATSVTANRGDIHIEAIKAAVVATANRGDITLAGITGQTTAHINSGGSSISAHSMGSGITIEGHAQDVTLADITGGVTLSGDFFGTTHLEHIAGPVHFHTSRTDFQLARLDGDIEITPDSDLSGEQGVGPVVLTTRDRNITLDRFTGDVSVTNRNGSVNLTAAPAIGNINIEDRNGSVSATLPEKASFSAQADTSDGNIDSDFQLSTNDSQNRKSLSGTVGAGGPLLRITTTNGDISIHKADVQPLVPAPPAPPRITLTPPPAPKKS